jgi:hypothetical protein
VLVDVGTGFYVEKRTSQAVVFYEEKIKELEGNLKGLEEVVRQKGQVLGRVEEGEFPFHVTWGVAGVLVRDSNSRVIVLRQKILAQQQEGGGGAGAPGITAGGS